MGLISKLKTFFRKLFRKSEEREQTPLTQCSKQLVNQAQTTTVKPKVSEVNVETAPPSLKTESSEVKPPVITSLKIEPEAKTEIQLLYEEYERLNKEKESIRREIEELDKRLAVGDLKPAERDRLFREKMVKVVGIAQRILEIKGRCAELGKPIE
ncbi:MAG: hypothetical protein OdinLCB4_006060 [Candidatus Odinarchaeum yellowstonii]|uniref:Uncharacterized protein n=1 Tax=Odinarchaeota yellowstonii (strain LCB_4) TaxID=1841599 RepID=A0AAF0D1K8_ODILC|nr:MAG: hypothetical protein OdinLCB4_006060 [Candidatus Odinarchaeum yellowstonii]